MAALIPRRRGLSPHGRGKPEYEACGVPKAGSIPARAGETLRENANRYPKEVYPRTGGGNPGWTTPCACI